MKYTGGSRGGGHRGHVPPPSVHLIIYSRYVIVRVTADVAYERSINASRPFKSDHEGSPPHCMTKMHKLATY